MNATIKLTLASVLVSVMLVLGYLENLLPVSGVPGIKLGLSNCVLLLSLYWLGVGVSFEMMVIKNVLLGLLLGNPMMIVYSLAGGTLSLTVMSLLAGKRGVSPVGAGIAGGVTHNIGQVVAAMLILQTPSLIFYLALLMPAGAAMGWITGGIATMLMRTMPPIKRLQKLTDQEETETGGEKT